jgi:hypothetical protein
MNQSFAQSDKSYGIFVVGRSSFSIFRYIRVDYPTYQLFAYKLQYRSTESIPTHKLLIISRTNHIDGQKQQLILLHIYPLHAENAYKHGYLNAYIKQTGNIFFCNKRSTCSRLCLWQTISDGFPFLYASWIEILFYKAKVRIKEAASVRRKLLYAILI